MYTATIPSHIRKKLESFFIVMGLMLIAWLLQITIVTYLPFCGAIANFPFVVAAVTGFVFGSPISNVTHEELRSRSTLIIFLHQLTRGSVAGMLAGAFAAALFNSILSVYPLSLPLVGWIAGYFCIRGLRQETLICIPMVLLATVLNEALNAWQFAASGYPQAYSELARIVMPEAVLNAIIAPFVYFPLRRWYEYSG
jgi:rod shape-determining protein MreD